ncbi:MAG: flagellar biosynthesis repressor FlbT [Alphaproteobacteria bacterium]|nr:flagellar biosynthesis repressor FlbT [Alphaproteobacteria bacterium]
MPLKISLKPNEKVLIGTAVICNGNSKSDFVVLNRVPVLREKDIITEEQADTVVKKLYFSILNMYIDPPKEKQFHKLYLLLLRQLIASDINNESIDLMVEMSRRIIEGDHYKALKLCKKLMSYEAEKLDNESTT